MIIYDKIGKTTHPLMYEIMISLELITTKKLLCHAMNNAQLNHKTSINDFIAHSLNIATKTRKLNRLIISFFDFCCNDLRLFMHAILKIV